MEEKTKIEPDYIEGGKEPWYTFTVSPWELWFWRIAVPIALLLSVFK